MYWYYQLMNNFQTAFDKHTQINIQEIRYLIYIGEKVIVDTGIYTVFNISIISLCD